MSKDQYVAWAEEADMYCEQKYGISVDEFRPLPIDGYVHETAEEFVDRMGEKYGLEDISDPWTGQRHGTSRVRITTYEPVVENPAAEGDEYRVEHPDDMHQNRFNPYWDMDD